MTCVCCWQYPVTQELLLWMLLLCTTAIFAPLLMSGAGHAIADRIGVIKKASA